MRRRRITVIALAVLALTVAACGAQSGPNGTTASSTASSATSEAPLPQGHPQVVQPVAGAAPKIDPASAPATAGVSVGPAAPSLPQPQSVADIRRQLAQSGMSGSTTQATLTPDGLAVAPIGAPAAFRLNDTETSTKRPGLYSSSAALTGWPVSYTVRKICFRRAAGPGSKYCL